MAECGRVAGAGRFEAEGGRGRKQAERGREASITRPEGRGRGRGMPPRGEVWPGKTVAGGWQQGCSRDGAGGRGRGRRMPAGARERAARANTFPRWEQGRLSIPGLVRSRSKTARNAGNFPLRLSRLHDWRGMGGGDSRHAGKFGTVGTIPARFPPGAVGGFSNGWKHFFQWLENSGNFFPMVGNRRQGWRMVAGMRRGGGGTGGGGKP